jgi:uncharacterized membrane protein YhaH (DUF805 family)
MHWLLDPIMNHYADFSGRASRQAYWMFALMYVVVFTAITVACGMYLSLFASDALGAIGFMFWAYWLIFLALFIPTIAIQVRRLHDVGYSGWWYLISFVPFFGLLFLLVLFCLPSQDGPNKYGPHPYALAVPTEPVPMPVPPPNQSAVG